MKSIYALAISIGGLAVVATWLFLGPLATTQMQVWQAFIAWGGLFHNGGRITGATKTSVCMILGAVIGAASITLAGHIASLHVLETLSAPIAVGIGVAGFVLAARIPAFATIPCSAYGFSCVGGLILLKGLAPFDAILPTIGSILIGSAFALLSEFIATNLTAEST